MGSVQISAIIPTFNRGHLVGRAIESALSQTRPPDEIILVDDGSTDETKREVARFGDRIRYLYQKNAGSAAARHNGMVAASHSWLALLDSDDVWLPGHLASTVLAIEATHGQARFYFADTFRSSEGEGRRHWENVHFAIHGDYQLVADASDWVMMGRQPMMLQATILNRQAYLECGGFWQPLRYRDDTHLFLKLGLGGPVCAVNHVGCQMTDDDQGNRLSTSYNRAKVGCWMQILMNEELLNRKLELKPAHRQELRRRLTLAYRNMARFALREGHLYEVILYFSKGMRTRPQTFLRPGAW